jgi:hypothetical protein
MDLPRGLLRHRKTFVSITLKSCLFRSMVLGLIVSYLALFPGCAGEGGLEREPSSADPTMQVNATTDVAPAPLQGDSESESPNDAPSMLVNAADAATSSPAEDFLTQSSQAEPVMLVNAADASTSTPQGDSGLPNVDPPMPIDAAEAATSTPAEDFLTQSSQAEPVMLVNAADASTSTPQGDSGLPNADPPMPIDAAEAAGMTSEGGYKWGSLGLVLRPFNSSGDNEAPEADRHAVDQPGRD